MTIYNDTHNIHELIGWLLFKIGKQVNISTDIAGYISYGYGKLDNNGFWQFPIFPRQ